MAGVLTLEDHLERIGWDGESPLFPGCGSPSDALCPGSAGYLPAVGERLRQDPLVVYYPGAGDDESILEFLEAGGRPLGSEGLVLILQDGCYDPGLGPVTPSDNAYMARMAAAGARVIPGLVRGDENPGGADMVYMRYLYLLLGSDNLAGTILMNTLPGTLIVGNPGDVGILALMHTGVELLGPVAARTAGGHGLTSFGAMLQRFTETFAYGIMPSLRKRDHPTRSREDLYRANASCVLRELSAASSGERSALEGFIGGLMPAYLAETFERVQSADE